MNRPSPAAFVVPRKKLWQMWIEGRLRFENEPLPLHCTDPDAFTPDGGEHAAARWADDGGRT